MNAVSSVIFTWFITATKGAPTNGRDPKATQKYLVEHVVPVYCDAIRVYTKLIGVVHNQLGKHKAEFADLESNTQSEINKLVKEIGDIATEIQFHVNKLSKLADEDRLIALRHQNETCNLVLELKEKDTQAKTSREEAQTELQEAKEAERRAEESRASAEESLAEAERKKASSCGRKKREIPHDYYLEEGHLPKKKRFLGVIGGAIKGLICGLGNAVVKALGLAKEKDSAAQAVYQKSIEDANKAKESSRQKQLAYEKAEKDLADGKIELQKKQQKADEYTHEFNTSSHLISKMNMLEKFMAKVHRKLTDNLKVVDKALPEVFSTLTDINKLFADFKPPDIKGPNGKSLKELLDFKDMHKLQTFSDEAEKAGTNSEFKELDEMAGGLDDDLLGAEGDEDDLADDNDDYDESKEKELEKLDEQEHDVMSDQDEGEKDVTHEDIESDKSPDADMDSISEDLDGLPRDGDMAEVDALVAGKKKKRNKKEDVMGGIDDTGDSPIDDSEDSEKSSKHKKLNKKQNTDDDAMGMHDDVETNELGL